MSHAPQPPRSAAARHASAATRLVQVVAQRRRHACDTLHKLKKRNKRQCDRCRTLCVKICLYFQTCNVALNKSPEAVATDSEVRPCGWHNFGHSQPLAGSCRHATKQAAAASCSHAARTTLQWRPFRAFPVAHRSPFSHYSPAACRLRTHAHAGFGVGSAVQAPSMCFSGERSSGSGRRASSTDRSPCGEALHLSGLSIRMLFHLALLTRSRQNLSVSFRFPPFLFNGWHARGDLLPRRWAGVRDSHVPVCRQRPVQKYFYHLSGVRAPVWTCIHIVPSPLTRVPAGRIFFQAPRNAWAEGVQRDGSSRLAAHPEAAVWEAGGAVGCPQCVMPP